MCPPERPRLEILTVLSSGRSDCRRNSAFRLSRSASVPRGFTLVEMLIVMIIMLIALGALIPAVTSMSKSNGRRAASSNLIGAIEQARAEAIKSGQPTYLVFPTTLSSTDPNLVQRYSYPAYAIFGDDPLNPATPKQRSGWKTLPT